ncbi:tRNA lysidine(34) synthetase TilS [Campylobacter geochelonis]|uniref:tRNA lysidine(34) synthetase TilS n=1 Tax=Campylobacter geochelonis TaxID=1780362 RepID=UPI0007708978|nr:tRNA lysidine(34) synthetase TilS [Campylobacter geochelonis]CZE47102.1 tRNA(Ile)-lysidine synthase [Campylobacter geochelonis]
MLNQQALDALKGKKALLAFSYGVDSTALFYLLEEKGVEFDLALVNYNSRKNSLTEELEARSLAAKFNKQIYIKSLNLSLQNSSNFEKTARDLRYQFFDEICLEFNYTHLITAHQLNDLFEWFLMRFSKGSGLVNLVGMSVVDKRQNYTIVRPLLDTSKDEIKAFLHSQKLKYFIDSSNSNTKFERNFIRESFSDKFVAKFSSGVKKSFEFLRSEKDILEGEFIYQDSEFFIVKNSPNAMNLIDKAAKKFGVVMSQKQRLEAKKECVISAKFSISYTKDRVFIAPYITPVMTKKFKETCRVKKVPKLLRGYISTRQKLLEFF